MTAAAYFAEVFRLLLGWLLISAARGKWRTLATFRSNLTESFGVSARVAAWLAPGIPAVEALLAAWLILRLGAPAWAAGTSLLLFAAFTLITAYKFFTESAVRCSCFGESSRPVSAYDLGRNVLVIIGNLFCMVNLGPAALDMSLWLLAVGMAWVAGMLLVHFHDIATLLVRGLEGQAS